MTRADALEVMAMLVAAWPTRQMPPSAVDVFALALGDLDADETKAAVVQLVQTRTFCPSIGEIRGAVVGARLKLPSAEQAWGIVRRAVSRVGVYRAPVFDCDEVDGAVEDIGWDTVCNAPPGDAPTRSRFCAAYEARVTARLAAEAVGAWSPPPRDLPPPPDSLAAIAPKRELVATGFATNRAGRLALSSPRGDDARALVDDAVARIVARKPGGAP